MLDDDARTAALSSVVLQLHRGCRTWPAAAFQSRACELLTEVLPFDGGIWGTESAATQRVVALYPYAVPDRVWSSYLTQGSGGDPLLAAARAAPAGTAVVMNFTHLAVPAADGVAAEPLHFFESHGLAQGLAMAQIEPLSKLRAFFCVWRQAGGQPFGPADQQLLQFVLPHLMETARESQLSRATAGSDAQTAPRSHAVCNRMGVTQHLDDRCLALLRLEWPQWTGGVLPAPLVQALQQPEPALFVGRRIAVRMVVNDDAVLLAVRLRAACDRLSARQRSIADLYASGCTGPEIAQRLGLAASTVNNHLGEVFKKLQVSSKVQLARVLDGSEV